VAALAAAMHVVRRDGGRLQQRLDDEFRHGWIRANAVEV
jgi:hypothetical protein